VLGVLYKGSEKARGVARSTMSRVREAVFGWDKLHAEMAASSDPSWNAEAGN
jgi:hypothetical protein